MSIEPTARQWHGPGALLAWVVLIACETLAQGSLKAGGEMLSAVPFGWRWASMAVCEPWVHLGAVGYAGAFAAWMTILDRIPLSKGFLTSSVVALSIVATSVLVFGERIGWCRAIGVAVVLVGLAVLGGETE